MQRLLLALNKFAYVSPYLIPRLRAARMRIMLDLLNLPSRARIIDLGGSEYNWKLIDHDFHVTMVNLPGCNDRSSDPAKYELVEGDACDLRDKYPDNSFDAVFSNSTIEHVGDEHKQAMFAAEVRRLAPIYWVQTPSPKFPIEIHTGLPLYWNLSDSARARKHERWHKKWPAWTDMIRETRVLSRERMLELFPDAKFYTERKFGLEKSNTAYRTARTPEG